MILPSAAVRTSPLACCSLTRLAGLCWFSPPTRTTGISPAAMSRRGETPAQAAAREVREELGILVTVGPLLVADWAPHPDEGDKLLLVFDGGTLTTEQQAAVRLPAEELALYAFHDPRQAAALLIP